jgi:hypothetical protein
MSLLLAAVLATPLAAGLAGPAAAQAAASIHWDRVRRLEPASYGGISAVSCPSNRLCVAVDQGGDVLISTQPDGGRWERPVRVDRSAALTGISCSSTSFCAAVDADGNLLTSTRPTGGARYWSHPARIDSAEAPGGGVAGLTGISCPTKHFCVAVDGGAKGDVVTSTNPDGGARFWTVTPIASGPLSGISCPTTSLCVASGEQHYVSSSPTRGASAWRATGGPAGGGTLSAIDCPKLRLCVGVGYGNSSVALADATNRPMSLSWSTTGIAPSDQPPNPGEGLADAIGCAGTTLCVALDTTGNAYTTTNPVGGDWSGPSSIESAAVNDANAITCTSTFCITVDSDGAERTGAIRG